MFSLLKNVKLELIKKMKSKKHIFSSFTLKFDLYVTDPRRPNVLPMCPARQKELPTPALEQACQTQIQTNEKYSFFHRFGQAKFASSSGLFISSSQFLLLLQLP